MGQPDNEGAAVVREYRPGSVMLPEQADEWAGGQADLSGGMAADEREDGYNESSDLDSSDTRPWAPGEPLGTQVIEPGIIELGASAEESSTPE